MESIDLPAIIDYVGISVSGGYLSRHIIGPILLVLSFMYP